MPSQKSDNEKIVSGSSSEKLASSASLALSILLRSTLRIFISTLKLWYYQKRVYHHLQIKHYKTF